MNCAKEQNVRCIKGLWVYTELKLCVRGGVRIKVDIPKKEYVQSHKIDIYLEVGCGESWIRGKENTYKKRRYENTFGEK